MEWKEFRWQVYKNGFGFVFDLLAKDTMSEMPAYIGG